jgi:hypothetical protein
MLSSIKRIEAKLDGTNFIKLNEFDVNAWSKSIWTESEITEYFANTEGFAYFDLFRKSFYIRHTKLYIVRLDIMDQKDYGKKLQEKKEWED